ncbi:MAG: alkaline phosphatase D family protein [Candidatus Hydrogenedentes bacterium]|nr:alkaline phosphatase D family protein [Candidatus Hydrogenedentota bacterium]
MRLTRIKGSHQLKKVSLLSLSLLLLTFVHLNSFSQLIESNIKTASFIWKIPEERIWVGPYLWANRLQDWRVSMEGLKSNVTRTNLHYRTVHLLSHRIGKNEGTFAIELKVTPQTDHTSVFDSFAGVLVGAGCGVLDFHSSAILHHSPGTNGGVMAGIDESGRAVIRDFTKKNAPVIATGKVPKRFVNTYKVSLKGTQYGNWCELWLFVFDAQNNELLSDTKLTDIQAQQVEGNIAIVAHPGEGEKPANFVFNNLIIKGSKLELVDSEDKEIGPIVGVLYTISKENLYMSAQTVPLGNNEGNEITLEIQERGNWTYLAKSPVNRNSWIAKFNIAPWRYTKDVNYRVVIQCYGNDGQLRPFAYYGKIRKEPKDKDTIVLGAFTCSRMVSDPGVDTGWFDWTYNKVWFPHGDWVSKVKLHNPDILFFSGDQIYEHASPTRKEVDLLDYLYRWYLWHWSFRSLTRERPTICIPDDHDIYQGNLWGAGGRPAKVQDDGGYVNPPEFVNAVQETQTAHLPPPFDPTPIEQGITVYYTDVTYAGISMAVIEDRKFKSSPKELLPTSQCENGWFQNYYFDPKKEADAQGAILLGERQMKFLNQWAEDWSFNAEFKVVLSQTLYASMSTLPANETRDSIIPKLELYSPSEYPEFYAIKADADTNGWPPSARNEALRIWRKCFALHICGDQHLGSTIQYGVENWNDASYAFCVPATSTRFPRRWFPPHPGKNRKEDAPRYTGEYEDGFGNKITVQAVANPMVYGVEPQELYNPATGYGIVRLNKKDRTITIECWPRWVNPQLEPQKQFPGWPITISQFDNHRKDVKGYLPKLNITGAEKPLIKVKDSGNNLIYAIRLNQKTFKPFVFENGTYILEVSNPETGSIKVLENLQPINQDEEKYIDVEL